MVNLDGTVNHSWISTGKVSTEGGSDGYYFMDRETKQLVRISGNIIITPLVDSPTVTINPIQNK